MESVYAKRDALGICCKNKNGSISDQVEITYILETVNFEKPRLMLGVGAEAGGFSVFASDREVDVVGIDKDLYGLKRPKFEDRKVSVIQVCPWIIVHSGKLNSWKPTFHLKTDK